MLLFSSYQCIESLAGFMLARFAFDSSLSCLQVVLVRGFRRASEVYGRALWLNLQGFHPKP